MSDALIYPEWLGRCLLENQLPWHLGRSLSLSQFHRKYTLDKSLWIGAFPDWAYGRSMTLVFNWEPYHRNPDHARSIESTSEPWLFLLLQINGVEEVKTSGYEPLLPGISVQRSIANVKQISNAFNNTLVIEDFYGAIVQITFCEDLVFLVLDADKQPIVI
jgi:hypothetical protein